MSTLSKRRAILVDVYASPRVVEIDDSLEGLQQAIGGRVENFARLALSADRRRTADFWCDEDGLDVRPLNRLVMLPGFCGEIWGPILITAADETTGETYSLTESEAEQCLALAASWPKLI